HDTVAATREIAERCAARGMRAVSGIEITAIRNGHDVHVLGYFLDATHDELLAFLAAQRRDRIARAEAIGRLLASAGLVIEIAPLRSAGPDALEAYQSDHPPEIRDRYLQLARQLDLLVTGGSDYHGDPAHGLAPGSVTLPQDEWARLALRAKLLVVIVVIVICDVNLLIHNHESRFTHHES